MATNKKGFMFQRLQGAEKYKKWNRDMAFVLQDVKLLDHIMGSARAMQELKKTKNFDKDRKKRIYQRWGMIQNSDLDVQKTSAKILKMYINTVKKNILLLKPQPNGTQTNFGNDSGDVTLCKILHQSGKH